jgi:hypothetical protein
MKKIVFWQSARWSIAARLAVIAGVIAVSVQSDAAEARRRDGQPAPPAKASPRKGLDDRRLLREITEFEAALRDAAERGQKIVATMPDKPGAEIVENFDQMRRVLLDTKAAVTNLLARRNEIDKKGASVLQAAATVREQFLRLAKRIEEHIAELQKTGGSPEAIQSATQALRGVKETAERGEQMIVPLKELVSATQRDAESIFSELSAYPAIFDFALETAELYSISVGDGVEFAALVQSLGRARENMKSIVYLFSQAAEKAESALKNVPTAVIAGPTL